MKYLVRYNISEAARILSDDVRMKYKAIPWRNMIGLRNILIHEYFGIDKSYSGRGRLHLTPYLRCET
ncbi:HepT-like ribonuclease domain-containing protein [Fontibacillus panacisegetis]|uniref:HepT-like ribonuclease domain-containing protein n=1 Tax=Fontibacillus solani TaxID=1572857 RepID=UPI0015FD2F73|nr:HepT-like ribonuclease domain-containing protein [Fontibacillus solani]